MLHGASTGLHADVRYSLVMPCTGDVGGEMLEDEFVRPYVFYSVVRCALHAIPNREIVGVFIGDARPMI